MPSTSTSDAGRPLWHYLCWFVVAAIFIALCLFATPYLIAWWNGAKAISEAGAFGDQFGLTNALFAGLAFAGVIVAIIMQAEELRLQRHELEETQAIMAGQQRQLEQQVSAMQKQAFENTFFQLVTLHHEIVSTMYVSDSVKGRHVFQYFVHSLKSRLNDEQTRARARSATLDNSEQALIGRIDKAYSVFYSEFGHIIGHYFRNLYHIVRYVDTSTVDNRYEYVRFIRAQLSDNELCLLFYNCCSTDHGRKKFLPLANSYNLFDNLLITSIHSQDERRLTTSSMAGERSTSG